MRKIRILIADDHKLVREIWTSFLNADQRFHVIASTGDSAEAVEFSKKYKPDIVLMDISLGPFSGIEAAQQINSVTQGSSRVIGVSIYSQPVYAKKILQMGAMGYVTKNSSKEEMIQAILEVHNGNKFICTEIKNIISENILDGGAAKPDVSVLTDREMEIINRVKQGESSKEIAALLNISLKTVEVHRHNILKKLNLKNSAALVNFINTTIIFPVQQGAVSRS
jgi:DNA-binding NarL/FixJ family response regulator